MEGITGSRREGSGRGVDNGNQIKYIKYINIKYRTECVKREREREGRKREKRDM